VWKVEVKTEVEEDRDQLDHEVRVDWLIEHLYSAHINSIKCSGCWADVLTYSLVSVCFHNLVNYAQRLQDLFSASLMFWIRTHTGPRFIVSSEGRKSHQNWAPHTNSKILVPDGAQTSRIGDRRVTTAPLALSFHPSTMTMTIIVQEITRRLQHGTFIVVCVFVCVCVCVFSPLQGGLSDRKATTFFWPYNQWQILQWIEIHVFV
jgi:hypothetical protein